MHPAGRSEQQVQLWEQEVQEADHRLAAKAAALRDQLSRVPFLHFLRQAAVLTDADAVSATQ